MIPIALSSLFLKRTIHIMKTFILSLIAFSATTALFAQPADEYKPAHYYDKKEGTRVDGFVNTSREIFHNFHFRKNLGDVETEKISTARITGMVIEQDSFAVIRNFYVESASSNANNVVVPVALGKVLETGAVNLYEATYMSDRGQTTMYSATSQGSIGPMKGKTKSTFVVQQQGTKKFVTVEVGVDDFVKQMSSFLKMSAPIVERVKAKEYYYDKTPQLVHDFNEWYKNR